MSNDLSVQDFIDAESIELTAEIAGRLGGYAETLSNNWRNSYQKWCQQRNIEPLKSVESLNIDKYFYLLKDKDFTGYFSSVTDSALSIAEYGYPFEAVSYSLLLYKEQLHVLLAKEFPGKDKFEAALIAIDRLYQYSQGLVAQAYFRILRRQIARQDITLEQTKKKLELLYSETKMLSITDSLTDLYNHQHFMVLLKHEFDRAARYHDDFCLLLIDVDNLKEVNEAIGDAAGDQILRSVADILRTTFRKTDILGRYDGGEFAAILYESDIDQSSQAAERLRTMVQIQTSKIIGFRDLGDITVSIGIANFFESDSVENLIHLAEQALHQAKVDGRNRIRYQPL